MYGVDTVKLVAPIPPAARLHLHPELEENRLSGRKGCVWYQGYDVPALGTQVTVKGVGASSGHIIWEGSVPKALGLAGVASPADALLWQEAVAECLPWFAEAYRTRVDCTCDLTDPDAVLRAAALGWKPHERARYVQAVYQNLETVWLHNKTRGVRVYDKFAESAQEWARDKSRVEYQIRGDWVARHGLRSGSLSFADNVRHAIAPVVHDLADRASAIGYQVPELACR